jgi:protein-S-isoprenylcysteine O-methyltransferase Ste14
MSPPTDLGIIRYIWADYRTIMDKGLLTQALVKFFLGVIVLGILIFVPAWSFRYWQGWLLMGILFVPMFVAGLVMFARNPELLSKRLNAKEQEEEQKIVVMMSGLLFIAAFVVAGLNWRLGWCILPDWAVWVAAGLFLASYLLYAEVLRENTYLSRTIEVQENQKVIDTGLYGIVRHPMYMATTVLFLAMPLVLASPISFIIMLGYIPVIAKRIKNEEKVLEEGLDGYAGYKKKVKYKILPFIW